MNCNNRWKDECSLLRQYMSQSSTSNNRSEILSQLTIPFRSHCDTFWNLDPTDDENVTECKKEWVCATDQWRCETGQCIDPRWVSDLERDCADASDEWALYHWVFILIQQYATLIPAGTALASVASTCNSTGLFFCLSSHVSDRRISCINQSRLGDNQIDCAGAIDESNTLQHCSQPSLMLGHHFKCPSDDTCIPYYRHCQEGVRCPNRMDDAHWCDWQHERLSLNCSGERDFICFNGVCLRESRCNGLLQCSLGEDEYMCDYRSSSQRKLIPYREGKGATARTAQRTFRLSRFPVEATFTEPRPDSTNTAPTTINLTNETSPLSSLSAYWCNRGIGIPWLNKSIVCFCPPQYYGDKCQYHADRLLLLLHLNFSESIYEAETDQNVVLKFFVLFLFNDQISMTHEFRVRPTLEIPSFKKHMVHFLHSKSSMSRQQRTSRYYNRSGLINSQSYAIRIEGYEGKENKDLLLFGVWQYPVYFDHLPVFRLAKALRFTAPSKDPDPCSNNPCRENEECRRLMNDRSEHICLCKASFSGENCSVKDQQCADGYCAAGSLCKPGYRGLLRGDSVPYCLCLLNRYGDRCGIEQQGCRSSPCLNGASCSPASTVDRVRCLCTKEYSGPLCERMKSSIRLSLDQNLPDARAVVIQVFDLTLTSIDLTLVHQQVHRTLPRSIEYYHDQKVTPAIVLAKIYSSSQSASPDFYLLSLSMNVAFINGRTEISETNRCPRLSSDVSPIRYHHMCSDNSNVLCFRDRIYLCICVDNRTRVECFRYDDQLDQCSNCLSGGRCLQGDRGRSNDFLCVCPACYSGRYCQFSSTSFTFNLDQLFYTDLNSPGRKATMSLLIAFPLLGFFFALPNNLFSFVTLRRRACLRNGAGHYLLCLSVMNQITLGLLTSGLIHLSLRASMSQSNPLIQNLFCKLFNYLLTCCIRLTDWMASFVALERVYTTRFLNKRWLKQPWVARRLLALIFTIVFFSSADELAFLQSFSDVGEERGEMCVVTFPMANRSLWIFIHQFVFGTHLLIPVLINIYCTYTITSIVVKSKMKLRRRNSANADEIRDRRDVLRDVLNENKELIARPAVTLVPSIFSLFTLPLFIIGFSLQCQNLEKNPLRYLLIVFYFITFIPQMITFILYIYPSSFYWKEWQATTIYKWLTAFRHSPPSKDSTVFSTIREQRTRDCSQPKKDG